MYTFYERDFLGYLWKGELRKAVEYLSHVPDQKDLYNKYLKVFEQGEYYPRTDNFVLGEIDKIYQKYYRNVFWLELPKEEATKLLFDELATFCGLNLGSSDTEDKVKEIVNRECYEFLGGQTQGYFGPYIWKTSEAITYEVELPNGIEPYQVIMMDGFVSLSWLDFISFGRTGTGGWANENGTLCCVKKSYDPTSEKFNNSFLKHEAQHAFDKKNYPNMSSTDLEYRTKLVELIYYSNDSVLMKILKEADNSNPDNSHAMAAYKIINGLSHKIFNLDYVSDEKAWREKLDDVKKYSRELLEESNQSLNTLK